MSIIEGASISAAARVVGASAASVSGWVKKGAIALERMRAMSAWRTSGRVADNRCVNDSA